MTQLTRRETISTIAAAIAATAVGPRAYAQGDAAKTSIDQAIAPFAESKQVPGIVAVAATDKGPIYQGAFGKRNIDVGPDMTPDSVFWIASMTKAITTAAAMQMVETGKLSLRQPIFDVLPELKDPQVLEGFDAAGAPRLRPAKRPITLHDLLTHTAGFGYDIWNADLGRYEKAKDLPALITCKNAALATPLTFDPGARWQYGINIDFAGKAVEKVSGKSLEDYFHDHIFVPLEMTDTAFRIGASQRERLVSMHARGPAPMHAPDSDGALAPVAFEMPQEPEFFMGGGGLYSTAADYLRFTRAILGDGSVSGVKILEPETVAAMSSNQIGALNVTMLRTVDPKSSQDAEFFPGLPKKWGYGFMINEKPAPTGRSAGSLAWAGLGNTYFWIDPAKRVTGVILMQFLPFADDKAIAAFNAFESAVYKTIG